MLKTKTTVITCLISSVVLIFAGSSYCAEWSDAEINAMASRAEATVQQAYKFLWNYRLLQDMADPVRDPGHTGVIGVEYSPLTTTLGYEDAKELSTRPGWAAWLVNNLAQRGIWADADIAVSLSGSFPGLNIAVLAALQELNIDVKGVCSVGASSYGANEIGFSWPEMERLLREEKILRVGCSAVTLGGTSDHGAERDEYSSSLALEAVRRSGLPMLKAVSLRDAVKKRSRFYGDPKDYVCYINVGGGHASLGGGPKVRYNQGGWYFEPLFEKGNPDGVMDIFLNAGVPCLNLLYLDNINKRERIINLEEQQ